jgi:hypothetical protein
MEEDRKLYRGLMGNLVGMSPLGRPRCRWEDWIRMDFREFVWGGV